MYGGGAEPRVLTGDSRIVGGGTCCGLTGPVGCSVPLLLPLIHCLPTPRYTQDGTLVGTL